MRVLHVIHSVNPAAGGAAEGLRQMAPAARALGHDHAVLTLDGPRSSWLAGYPAPIEAIGPVASTYGFHRRLAPRLREHAREHDAMVVHGLWQYIGLAVRHAALAAGKPYFVYTHGMLDPWFKRRYPIKHLKKCLYWPWGEYRVLRDAQAVLFTAEDESRLAAQSFAMYRAREAVVGYGVALDGLARAATAASFFARFPQACGRRLVLFLGRLHEKKGCELLIGAFADFAAADPDLMLVMAGPDAGGHRARLEALAHRMGVTKRVLWTGMLVGGDKWSAFRAAEVFALPSHQENFGVAVVEALAMGLPVLVSKRVNIWREIVQSDAGLAEEDDLPGTKALLARWLRLTRGERASMSHAASACFAARFHIDGAACRLALLLEAEVARSRNVQRRLDANTRAA